MFSLYLRSSVFALIVIPALALPVVFNCLDDEAQSWTDTVHILIHNSLDDGCLSSVVQTPTLCQRRHRETSKSWELHSINIRISLSFRRAFRKIDSIFYVDECYGNLTDHQAEQTELEVEFVGVG
jgi:hypothetical protein